jgi:hypothetical protein
MTIPEVDTIIFNTSGLCYIVTKSRLTALPTEFRAVPQGSGRLERDITMVSGMGE